MRAGALSDASVAAALEKDFVCAWEKKGAVEVFKLRNRPDKAVKFGGNILTYVTTPRGEVIHAIPRAAPTRYFLDEIRWAVGTYRKLAAQDSETLVGALRASHRKHRQEQSQYWIVDQSCELLETRALLPIAELERDFFEKLLGQTYAPDKDIIIREVDAGDFEAVLARMPRG